MAVALSRWLAYTFALRVREVRIVPESDWLTWAFWTRNTQGLRDLALIAVALVGVPFVIWRTIATHFQSRAALRQAETASKRHEQQTDADRQRRISDSFARAIEQLGSEKLEVRLGAIYALERIARESPTDHWPIMETLTAYVREKGPRIPGDPEESEQLKDMRDEEDTDPRTLSADVQAALTVVGRRRHEHDPDRLHLDLSSLDLSYANLREAHLEKCDLSGSFLINAGLNGAKLCGAELRGACLHGAGLQFADLTRARLPHASLADADLEGAVLDTVDLTRATLSGARLVAADLQKGVVGLTQEQLDEAWGDSQTRLPEGMTIPHNPPKTFLDELLDEEKGI